MVEPYIPGAIPVAGREFIYVRIEDGEDARKLFLKVVNGVELPAATAGGAKCEDTTIRIPSGDRFLGFSYRGDLAGWKADIVGGAEVLGRRTALIDAAEEHLVVSDGRRYSLAECLIDR